MEVWLGAYSTERYVAEEEVFHLSLLYEKQNLRCSETQLTVPKSYAVISVCINDSKEESGNSVCESTVTRNILISKMFPR